MNEVFHLFAALDNEVLFVGGCPYAGKVGDNVAFFIDGQHFCCFSNTLLTLSAVVEVSSQKGVSMASGPSRMLPSTVLIMPPPLVFLFSLSVLSVGARLIACFGTPCASLSKSRSVPLRGCMEKYLSPAISATASANTPAQLMTHFADTVPDLWLR